MSSLTAVTVKTEKPRGKAVARGRNWRGNRIIGLLGGILTYAF